MLSREGSIQWVLSCGGVFSGPDSNFETIDQPIYIYNIHIYKIYIHTYIYIQREREREKIRALMF